MNDKASFVTELESCLAAVTRGVGQSQARYRELTLHSHFQPIFSLAHSRAVGYEALMRARSADGVPISPAELFGRSRDAADALRLDRLSRTLHMQNFCAHAQAPLWLFLNINPQVFVQEPQLGEFFPELLRSNGMSADQIVLEVLEDRIHSSSEMGEAVSYYRSLGFLIAIDDFGAGHSNFDRVWRLQPQIVKLDRSMLATASASKRVRRMMSGVIGLLHEAGALVVVEGVETLDEALIAMDSDADFVQGYFFARPSPAVSVDARSDAQLAQCWNGYRSTVEAESEHRRKLVGPYMNGLGYSATLLESGYDFASACAGFLELERALRCYLLDSHGRQVGVNAEPVERIVKTAAWHRPLVDVRGANWSRRYYFRKAVERTNRIQVTRPYLSITGAEMCVTVSTKLRFGGQLHVLCGDISWDPE